MARKKVEEPKKKKAIVDSKNEGSWFTKGTEGFKRKKQQDVATAMKKEKAASRVWLKEGSSRKLVFCDDVGFFVYEHNLKIDGKYGNYVTCTKDFKPCPLCNEGLKSVYTAYFSVIDTSEYTRKDGTKTKNRKVLYPAKKTAIIKLEKLKEKYDSLVGMCFNVSRLSSDSPNCGDDFEKVGKVKLSGDMAKPIEYAKVLAPPTPEELAGLGFGSSIVGSEEDLNDGDKESELPEFV